MSGLPKGYHAVAEEDRKKAKVFFDRGATVAGTGNYEYAIEMFLQGLAIDPDAKDAHQSLRDIALRRKASGGKDLGMLAKMRLPRPKDDLESMLRAERLMAFSPGDTENMLAVMKAAHRAGFYDTVVWIGAVLLKANNDQKTPDFNKFLAARDIYADLQLWGPAVDACQYAAALKPDDMELSRVLRNLSANLTLQDGNYAGSFRDSIKDMDGQKKLMEQDMDIHDQDVIARQISIAQTEYDAEPNEAGKLARLVDALVKSELMENENRAIELLQEWYDRTKQFRFRLTLGKIKIAQLRRQDRAERARLRENSKDEALVRQYVQFRREKTEAELKEYQLFADNYPTDMTFRHEVGIRLFELDQPNEAIAILQQSRTDPKLRVDSSTYLGRAFLATGFVDEAVDTLKQTIDEYEIRGDTRSKELYDWHGTALEKKGDLGAALKAFSQLVQWDFNYRDVQSRIKTLRGAQSAKDAEAGQ